MEVITLSGVIILCIALIYKYDKNIDKKSQGEIFQDEQESNDIELIKIKQEPKIININPESDLNSIKKDLHEIKNTLSFFKTLLEIAITFIIIKYIILAIIISEVGDKLSRILRTF